MDTVLITQLCPTLCDPLGYSLPAPLSMGILQAGTLEWVAISFSRGSFQPRIESASPVSPALHVDSYPLRCSFLVIGISSS